MGWGSLQNGDLLRQAAREFDAFVTIDQGIRHQQRLPRGLAMVTIQAISNDIDDIRPLVPSLLATLARLSPGEDILISSNGVASSVDSPEPPADNP
jgi:hypothetical protein